MSRCAPPVRNGFLFARDGWSLVRYLVRDMVGRSRGLLIDRVNIGTKEMLRNTGFRFDGQDIFRGQSLAALKPLPDRGLGYTAYAGDRRLRAGARHRVVQSFEGG